ncbi:hypothetical protein [Klebsiella michiganensis]|uniref:hypothetical protein n=1 Tax=Klebsiella michiganensis TaxID=1134687 RepID=UPI0007DAE3B3|nr:hypothetical protein [Klebsiella michiganensis]
MNNPLAENSVTQLLNSVKLARDNAERDDNRVDHSFYYALARALEELQEHRKAAMDSEPVAWIVHARTGDQLTTDGGYVANAEGILGLHSTPLYRHAQQPVVPPEQHWEELCREHPDMSIGDAIIRAAWWNHCHAAMLQELQKSAGVSNNCRSCENVQDLQAGNSPAQGGSRCSIKAAPALDSSPKTAESRCGNSPVIPDGSVAMLRRWLVFGRGMQNAGSQLPHNLIAETESMLAAAPTGIPMIPDGYVMVPKEPTETMINAWLSEVANWRGHVAGYKAMLAVAPQEVK